MTRKERDLHALLGNNVDNFDNMALGMGGNLSDKPFTATFDLQLKTRYFTVVTATGVATAIAPAALNGGLQNRLPFFLFGQGDYESGYPSLKGQFPVNANWSIGRPIVYGKDAITEIWDATILGQLEDGDLVIPFTSTLPGGGTTTLGINIVRCPQVAYGSLLAHTSSDTFEIDGIRYVLDDVAQVSQFSNKLQAVKLSLFGRAEQDSYTPNSSKSPEQFQAGIVDIPIIKGIDKHQALGFFNLYTNIDQSMSIFVRNFSKVSAM